MTPRFSRTLSASQRGRTRLHVLDPRSEPSVASASAARAGRLEQVHLPHRVGLSLEGVGVDADGDDGGVKQAAEGFGDAPALVGRAAAGGPYAARHLAEGEVHAPVLGAACLLEDLAGGRPDVERGLAELAAVGDGDEADHVRGGEAAGVGLLEELLAVDLEDADELPDAFLDEGAAQRKVFTELAHGLRGRLSP